MCPDSPWMYAPPTFRLIVPTPARCSVVVSLLGTPTSPAVSPLTSRVAACADRPMLS
jgi:hypothetical protein